MKLKTAVRTVVTVHVLVILSSPGAYAMNVDPVVDFAEPKEQSQWVIVNDGVMGGLSESRFALTEAGTAVFEGLVSLENNGGFASVRRRPAYYVRLDADGIVLRVKGDGRRYQFRMRTDDRFDGVAYSMLFDTEADQWITVRLPFADFRATYRGRPVPEAPALMPTDIRQIGFLIADKRSGPFRLEIATIGAWDTKADKDDE